MRAIRFAAYLALIGSSVYAQDVWEGIAAPGGQPDSVELRAPTMPEDVAELHYYNSISQISNSVGGRWVEHDGIRVRFRIEVHGPERNEGREHFTVIEIDPPEYVAMPADIWALDGETVVIRILPPMF